MLKKFTGFVAVLLVAPLISVVFSTASASAATVDEVPAQTEQVTQVQEDVSTPGVDTSGTSDGDNNVPRLRLNGGINGSDYHKIKNTKLTWSEWKCLLGMGFGMLAAFASGGLTWGGVVSIAGSSALGCA